jgi:hypothetical protein
MSTHYEGCDADATVGWDKPGTGIGEDQLAPGQYALVISYDEVFYVTGTPDQLVGFAERMLRQAQAAKSDAQGPLHRRDFYRDEDHDFVCPRDGDVFSPGNYDDVAELVQAIDMHILANHSPAAVQVAA